MAARVSRAAPAIRRFRERMHNWAEVRGRLAHIGLSNPWFCRHLMQEYCLGRAVRGAWRKNLN